MKNKECVIVSVINIVKIVLIYMPKKEKNTQQEFRKAFFAYLDTYKKKGFFWKIGDYGARNPFDCFLVVDGKFISCELKICKEKKFFNFKKMFRYGKSRHELDYLMAVHRAGGHAFVIVNHFLGRGENDLYIFPVNEQTLHIFDKSVKIDKNLALPKIKTSMGTVWDLGFLIEYNDDK